MCVSVGAPTAICDGDALLDVLGVGQPQVLLGRDVSEHQAPYQPIIAARWRW